MEPGYAEAAAPRPPTIEGLAAGAAAFVGPTSTGPSARFLAAKSLRPEILTSFHDFERIYGGMEDVPLDGASIPNYVAHAANVYFGNGGTQLYVVRVTQASESARSRKAGRPTLDDYVAGLRLLDTLDDVSIVAAPGYSCRSDGKDIQAALIAHAGGGRASRRLAVLDAPPHMTVDQIVEIRTAIDSPDAALYYPWVSISNPTAGHHGLQLAEINVPPCGFVCGIYARNDAAHGIWNSTGNQDLIGALQLEQSVSSSEQDRLSSVGVNCLRLVPGERLRIWGTRTTSSDPQWKYVNVRRYYSWLQRSIEHGLQWAVHEPNDAALRSRVRHAVADFLYAQWQLGAFVGCSPDEAYFVRCDLSTMTQNDVDEGRLICMVGLAMLKPAEFLSLRIVLLKTPP